MKQANTTQHNTIQGNTMAQAKMSFKTPLLPLSWVSITGKGKAKKGKDQTSDDPKDFNYTATVIYPDEASMKVDKAIFDKFWKDNKPSGIGGQCYKMFKPEMVKVLDDAGKPQEDEEGATIKKATGRWTLQAKTITHWPRDGKQNTVKVLRANGNPLNLGEKQIGNDSTGVIHGSVGINAYEGNEGLAFYLNAVQLKKFVEFTGADDVESDDLGDDEGLDELDVDAADMSKEDLPDV